MTTWDDETKTLKGHLKASMKYPEDIVDVFRDEGGHVCVVIRGPDDDDIMLQVL